MVEATLYNKEYLRSVQDDISKKLALFTNKDLKNSVYNLGLNPNIDKYDVIWEYWEILEKITECNSCYNNQKIEDIITNIKNQLNVL